MKMCLRTRGVTAPAVLILVLPDRLLSMTAVSSLNLQNVKRLWTGAAVNWVKYRGHAPNDTVCPTRAVLGNIERDTEES